MVAESWFSSLWRNSWKSAPEPEKATVGILAFEVVSLMSKLVSLWNSLSDKEIARFRAEVSNSLGVRKLVSDDDDFLMDLASDEIIENFGYVAKAVVRLGKRCTDPVFHRLEQYFNDPIEKGVEWYGWEYRWKKMERKVKKMDRFIAATLQLHQELDVLTELEQTLRRMQVNTEVDRVKLLEFQQKVMWQRQEVRHLREMSPWNRTYDYTVRLMARSLFTILERIQRVFEISQRASLEGSNISERMNADRLPRSHSFSTLMQSSVHPSETNLCGFYSGPLGSSVSKPIVDESRKNTRQRKAYKQTSLFRGKNPHLKSKRLAHVGSFKGCMNGGSDSPILQSCKPTIGGSMRSTVLHSSIFDKKEDDTEEPLSYSYRILAKVSFFNSKGRLTNAPPNTLGDAALALHYANVIILIDKLASSPHLIGPDARDDLYNMLPITLRNALRGRLKLYAKTLASSVFDASLAAGWSSALARILEWLAPLAHSTIRWQSERNFEKQHMASRTNVLLVQTLHYANQGKTEAAVTELLIGLNYICRFGRELDENALESAGNRSCGNYLRQRETIACNV